MKRIVLLIGGSTLALIAFAAALESRLGFDWTAAAEEPGIVLKSATRKVDINTAMVRELERLPGMGPEVAERIVQHRPYKKLDELIAKKVLGRKQFARIKERIRVGSLAVRSTVQ